MKKKTWKIAIAILVIVFGGIFVFDFIRGIFLKRIVSNFIPPPQVVSTVIVKSQDWQPILPVIGQVSSLNGIDISPEVSGRVQFIYFTAGENVKAGDKLIQLDDASETAQLKSIDAQLHNAEVNLKRISALLERNATSKGSYDDALALQKKLQADSENLQALKSKKLLRAPFAGQTGIGQVSVGEFVNPGQTCLSLQTLNTLYVTFSVSQKDYSKLNLNTPVEITVDAYPNEKFFGHVTAFDSRFNEETHTLEVQAGVDASNLQLLPGMFVNIDVLLPLQHDVLILPQTAIIYSLYGESAFIVHFEKVKEDGIEKIAVDKNGFLLGKVQKVFVKTGDKRNNFVVINEGLKPGDVVVDSGQNKLEDGGNVVINNSMPLPERVQ